VGKAENLILAAHGVSDPFRRFLEETLGIGIPLLTLSDLRKRSFNSPLGFFRDIKIDTLFLVWENDSGRSFLPMLITLSLFSGAQSVHVIGPAGKPKALHWRQRIWAVFRFLFGMGLGQLSLLGSMAELTFLRRKNRIAATSISGRSVLYLMPGLWTGPKTGGAIAHVAGVVNALVRAGKKVDFASLGEAVMIDSRAAVYEAEPFPIMALPSEANLYLYNRHFVRKVLSHFDSGRTGFVYSRMMLGNYAGVRISRALSLPLVVEYNGSEVWVSRTWGRPLHYEKLAMAAEEACLRHAHMVVTVSETLKGQLLEKGVPEDRIVCHPNGVDPDIFDPNRYSDIDIAGARRALDIPVASTVIAFVGTFGRWHGSDVLAMAIRELVESAEDWLKHNHIRFVFVGDGAMRSRAEEILDTRACDEFVLFAGLVPQEEAPLYMALSDVLVSPHVPNDDGSRFFGSPTKLFEYLSMARPVIASDLEQIGQVLEGNPSITNLFALDVSPGAESCAVLTEPGNVEQLTKAIQWVVENEDWRQSAGPAARRHVGAHFTWDKHVDAVLKALKRMGE
jgi:glycosyltransferase involved in cell wall biosynthesis